MATLRTARLTKDPRTGIWILRRRVPSRYAAVAAQKGGFVKITTGTADHKAAAKAWPDVLRQWEAKEAGWERLLNVRALTPQDANEIAARWAAWIAADLGRLEGDPNDAAALETSTPEGKLVEAMFTRGQGEADPHTRATAILEARMADALGIAGVSITPGSRDVLAEAMRPVVAAAYRQASLRESGVTGVGARWNPLQTAQKALPTVPAAPKPARPGTSLDALLEAWKAVAVVKPRTVKETEYILKLVETFVGHSDGSSITKDDLRRWRDASKADGRTNNTWNNRLSLVSQVFAQAMADGLINENPADGMRLRKNQVAARLPYTDLEAAKILLAARAETTPSRRWAHWVMAFSGMRVAEVLQMTRGDVRQEGDIWFMAVHEDDEGKSVKTGQRRSVPIHPALIAEGFLAYVQSLPADCPLFPEKAIGAHGGRGERGWNAVGKWVRATVGIRDPQKAPNHSWRHRLEDELRAAEVPEDARDAIVGHARKTTGRSYGVRGEALARLHRGLSKVPVPPGVVAGEGRSDP